jgi:hypothetical protein
MAALVVDDLVAFASTLTGAPARLVRAATAVSVRAGAVLVRFDHDPTTAARALSVARVLADAGMPASLACSDVVHAAPGGWSATLWQWEQSLPALVSTFDVGRVVARLHQVEAPQSLASSRLFDEASLVLDELLVKDPPSWRAQLATLVSVRAGLVGLLEAACLSDPLGRGVVHGDVHARNILRTARGLVVIDLETAGAGPRSLDLAVCTFRTTHYRGEGTLQQLHTGYVRPFERFDLFDDLARLYAFKLAVSTVELADSTGRFFDEANRRVDFLTGRYHGPWTYV